MTHLGKVALVAGALALSGCGANDRFGGAGMDDGAMTGADAAGMEPGSASDPTSPAYFEEAVGDRVFFAVDQSTLTDEARSVLDEQAEWLTTNSDFSATIEGHADEQGTREYNIALGDRRANAVRDYLVSRGVAQNRLRTVSFGKERPVALCSDESCYSQNRRAVTVLALGAGV
ncbi:peptidoglycan-associated lipoprotein Pal [Rhodosalinus sp.]|uniref:peptidoglycan-associated lipoprotein Pal n=1 Tax=Rhodosalinus sp. TaxID=2047741 RepID=UPI00397DB5BD